MTMCDVAGGIDHVIIAVPDLEAASAEFEKNGFFVTDRAIHERFGTANRLIVLNDIYIELLTIENRDPPVRTSLDILEPCLSEGGGIPLIALATKDTAKTALLLKDLNFNVAGSQFWSRRATTPDGTFEAKFSTLFFSPSILLETITFFCQHHTPSFIWHPQWQNHPNGATKLKRVLRYSSSSAKNIENNLCKIGFAPGRFDGELKIGLGDHEVSYRPASPPGWQIDIETHSGESELLLALNTVRGVVLNLHHV